jgi:hypothetical protein
MSKTTYAIFENLDNEDIKYAIKTSDIVRFYTDADDTEYQMHFLDRNGIPILDDTITVRKSVLKSIGTRVI